MVKITHPLYLLVAARTLVLGPAVVALARAGTLGAHARTRCQFLRQAVRGLEGNRDLHHLFITSFLVELYLLD